MSLLREMKRQGYTIHLFFLWLPSVEMAIARVANRVREGGHPVPEPVIRRRFVLQYFGQFLQPVVFCNVIENITQTDNLLIFNYLVS